MWTRASPRAIFEGVGQDILHVIATEAASLIENARLVQAEEESRRYQQELSIAASIQQRLMQVKIPDVPFAKLRGRNLLVRKSAETSSTRCNTKDGLAVILADVSGKGVSAALLASIAAGNDLFAPDRGHAAARRGDRGESLLHREDDGRKIRDPAAGAVAARR